MRDPDAIVRPLKPQEVDAAASVLANAFSDDPIFRFILGDRDDMEVRLGHLFRDAAEAELRKSAHLVEIVDSGNAVALWHEVDDWKTSPTALLRSVPSVVKAFGARLPRALQVLTSAEKVHPSEPHRHLMYIGTHKEHEGEGLGSALLGSMLERCDDDGIPTYLESTNPANDAWYRAVRVRVPWPGASAQRGSCAHRHVARCSEALTQSPTHHFDLRRLAGSLFRSAPIGPKQNGCLVLKVVILRHRYAWTGPRYIIANEICRAAE